MYNTNTDYNNDTIIGCNRNWFEGAKRGLREVPTTDNGLEGLNSSIKNNYTLRARMLVNEYLENCSKMLTNWSKDSVGEKW